MNRDITETIKRLRAERTAQILMDDDSLDRESLVMLIDALEDAIETIKWTAVHEHNHNLARDFLRRWNIT